MTDNAIDVSDLGKCLMEHSATQQCNIGCKEAYTIEVHVPSRGSSLSPLLEIPKGTHNRFMVVQDFHFRRSVTPSFYAGLLS